MKAFTLIELWSAAACRRFSLSGTPKSGAMAPHSKGFTLIELLVVVTIIVILLALLTPALDKALEKTELTICMARHKGLGQVFTNYAVDFKRKYPSGKRSADGYEHLPFVPHTLVNYVKQNAGHNKSAARDDGGVKWGNIPELLNDPSFAESFGYSHVDYGAVIGYIYLGGHPAIDAANNGTNGYKEWDSPMGFSDQGSGELTVCWNEWTLGINPVAGVMVGQFSVSAHIQGGGALGSEPPIGGHFYHPGSGQDVRVLGTIGGNVGFADGSAGWRDVKDMHERIGGSSAGEQNTAYPTLW